MCDDIMSTIAFQPCEREALYLAKAWARENSLFVQSVCVITNPIGGAPRNRLLLSIDSETQLQDSKFVGPI